MTDQANTLADTLADTAARFRHLGDLTTAALVVGASVYAARAEAAIQESIDPQACLAREVDRVAPGWRVELAGAVVRIPPMPCPRCGWPARRRCMPAWREVTVETLAEGHGGHPGVDEAGSAEVTVLRHPRRLALRPSTRRGGPRRAAPRDPTGDHPPAQRGARYDQAGRAASTVPPTTVAPLSTSLPGLSGRPPSGPAR